MTTTPFVVGQWVRGEKFYGRTSLIHEILNGHRNCLWVLGTRRVGKTSILKQLEHMTVSDPSLGYLPLFWDFQGTDSAEELHLGFGDALLDAEEQLDRIGVDLAEVESDDLFTSLGKLRRKLRPKNVKLLLLCDEVEELISLSEDDPSLLRKLRRAMQSQEAIRSVLASSLRLWALAEQGGDTSPFLHGFAPPLYIRTLCDDEATALIRQTNLPEDSRPGFDDAAVQLIRERCDNHPYLIQLICKRYQELGDLEDAFEQVAADQMVSYFFSVDFEMLTDRERSVVRFIAENTSSTSKSIQGNLSLDSGSLGGSLHRLEHLGYVRRNEERRYILTNYFFLRWLTAMPPVQPQAAVAPAKSVDPPTVEVRLSADLTTMTQAGPAVIDNRYELRRMVGRGATGVVYKAFDRLLKEDIAVKMLRQEYSQHEEALDRIRKEILLTRDLNHVNIVATYYLGTFEHHMYLTMKWVDGMTLADRITRHGRLQPDTVVTVGTKLASALKAAHAQNILHRDIKPANVLMDNHDEPYIVDFGLARLLGQPGTTRTGIFIGTPHYASPEQARLMDLDARSDVYSLGLVLFEMATGKRPFEAGSNAEALEKHTSQSPPVPRDLVPDVSVQLSNVILQCLRKEPNERYASASILLEALEALPRADK